MFQYFNLKNTPILFSNTSLRESMPTKRDLLMPDHNKDGFRGKLCLRIELNARIALTLRSLRKNYQEIESASQLEHVSTGVLVLPKS